MDYTWLVQIYLAYNKAVRKAGVDELKIGELSKKTVKLIQQTIDVKKIEDMYPTVNVDQKYVEALRKSTPKTLGAAIDVLTAIQHEVRSHPSSPFFINLSREVEKTYEELRNRKATTAQAIKKLLEFSETIAKWKQEQREIGKEKYPIYEAIKVVIPEIAKERALDFVNLLLSRLESNGLIFRGWQVQRDVRRKLKAEIKVLLLSRLKDYKNRADELTEKVFEALEGIEWKS
jgi:hypothetical protein